MSKYGDISPLVAAKASRRFLKTMQPLLVTQRFGQPETMDKNAGQILKWRRYENFPPALAPAAEGVTPDPQSIRYTDYQVQLQQYIAWVPLTDVIADTHTDPVLKIMVERLGEQAAQTVELITIDVLKAGTNVDFTGSATQRSEVSSPVSRGDFMRVVRTLDRANAQRISSIIAATPNVATRPVEAAFFAMCHTDLKPDLRNVTGFQPVAEYASHDKAVEGEFGRILDVRIICTQNFKPWLAAGANTTTMLSNGAKPASAAPCDVYPIIIVGKEAYGIVRLQGYGKAEIMVLNPGVARESSDPAGQRGSVAWKLWYAAVILNQSWIVRLETACSASPS